MFKGKPSWSRYNQRRLPNHRTSVPFSHWSEFYPLRSTRRKYSGMDSSSISNESDITSTSGVVMGRFCLRFPVWLPASYPAKAVGKRVFLAQYRVLFVFPLEKLSKADFLRQEALPLHIQRIIWRRKFTDS